MTGTRLCILAVLMPLGGLQADPKLDFAYGILAEQRGEGEKAAESMEKARLADPEAMSLVRRGVSLRMAKGDRSGAAKLYQDLAKKHPERTDLQLLYGDFLKDTSPRDEAVAKQVTEIFEAALKRSPDDLTLQKRLFALYQDREMRDRSTAIYQKLAATAEPSPAQVMAVAEMSRKLFPGDDLAVQAQLDKLFRETLKSHPQSSSFARAASENFRKSGHLDQAVEMLEWHVAAVPSSLDLRTRLGVLLLANEREKEGEKALLDVLAINPRQGLAQQSLAKLYRQQGRVEEALPHASEALKIRGGGSSDFLELAAEFLDASKPREARLLLERAVFFHPDDAALSAKLAIASHRDPEVREASSRLFREADQLSGGKGPTEEPDFLFEYANSMVESGQIPAAEERLRQAIKAYPEERKKETAAAMRRLAGLWTEQKKNGEAAASLLKRADSLDPPP